MSTVSQELVGAAAQAGAAQLATHWGTRIASRLVPGAGWALLAYDGISLGGSVYETVTGEKFADTRIGGVATKYTDAVDSVAAKTANAAFTGVSAVLSFAGMNKAAAFVSNDARYFVMGENASPAAGPNRDATPSLAKTKTQPVADRDLPSTDVRPLSPTDAKKIAAPAVDGPTLSLAEASARVDQVEGAITPERANASQMRLASLISGSQSPSQLDILGALAIQNSRDVRPASPRAASNGIELT
ncbi:MAG TPA: hypothetical protein P5256_00075 [Beijerinckiaceae bacterium]|nr:hypothetical protein [Rhodoblastus sp.]MCB1533355.1 hypothetical protein [Rhodoblastus sp.]MCC2106075.1 hypothetical protein [Hyphomicrobiales bacterium]HRY01491.1 hypothetical protein [Beijerinckiaceae bacterium]